jgi:hypothetical protein
LVVQVEAEVLRLESLKAGAQDLVLKKHDELKEMRRRAGVRLRRRQR